MIRPHKYHAKRTDCTACGKAHPSRAEAKRCAELALLERDGVIIHLRRQEAFALNVAGTPILSYSAGYPGGRVARMTWDFYYIENGVEICEDTKGVSTTDFRLRLAVFQACYPGIRVLINGVPAPCAPR